MLVLGAVLGTLGFAMDCGYAFAARGARLKRFRRGEPRHRRGLHRARRRRRAHGRPALILEGDNLPHLRELPDGVAQMVYADPPFNTGRTQTRRTLATTGAPEAATGPASAAAATRRSCSPSPPIKDEFDDYLGFLAPAAGGDPAGAPPHWHALPAPRLPRGALRKLLLDELFGRDCFLNELIWAYDYGAKPKGRWPQKHDTILVYVKDPRAYYFDSEAVDREPYMAPGLVTPEKVARGKRPCR